jgi:hypothetical protein
MDLFSPLRLGLHVATDAMKLASAVPRAIIHQLTEGDGDANGDRYRYRPQSTAQTSAEPASRPPGGTGGRAPSPRVTPGRATAPDGEVEVTAAPPEPTSAAGASGGVAGTAAAPGAAAAVGAPDPTAATSTRAQPIAPQGERRTTDVSPPARARRRQATTPKHSEVDRIRAQQREPSPADIVESEGAASPGPELHVEAPWEGYEKMKVTEIVDRLQAGDDATKAIVRLYEQTHKKRKSILDATAS